MLYTSTVCVCVCVCMHACIHPYMAVAGAWSGLQSEYNMAFWEFRAGLTAQLIEVKAPFSGVFANPNLIMQHINVQLL